jgi:hypothetical protein
VDGDTSEYFEGGTILVEPFRPTGELSSVEFDESDEFVRCFTFENLGFSGRGYNQCQTDLIAVAELVGGCLEGAESAGLLDTEGSPGREVDQVASLAQVAEHCVCTSAKPGTIRKIRKVDDGRVGRRWRRRVGP